jgi:alkaline phosphatase
MTMKLRNRLIALVCLILFLGIGAALLMSSAKRKPFAVILFVADNINSSALTSSRVFSGGGDARLQLEDLPNTALCRNAANDYSVPGGASASTAIAGGRRVNRGSLCVDPRGGKLRSLLELASDRGRSTGLLTTGEIISPTSAAYFAKTLNADDIGELRQQFCTHAPFDFVAGGGGDAFMKKDDSADQKSRGNPSPFSPELKQLSDKNVAIMHSMNELEKQPFWKRTPVLALLSPGPLSPSSFGEGNLDSPSLSDLVRVAIRNLQANRRGYLLVVDDPMIAAAGSANDAETMFARILSLDQAIATARRYAGENALIVLAGRENVGGLELNGYPLLRDKGVAILALNNQGYPSLCWSTGPGFSTEKKNSTSTHPEKSNPSPGILSQPSAHSLPTAVGTAGDVLAIGIGQGSEKLHGFLDLTEIHTVIKDAL